MGAGIKPGEHKLMSSVLVVEDDLSNAQVFKAVLRRIGGFEVTVTEDVGEVLNLARSRSVDLVIMDVSLSNSYYNNEKYDGVGITRLLKSDPSTREIPVLLTTAHAMTGDRERLLGASGAEDYVTKPVMDHHDLIARIRKLIELRKPPPLVE